MCWKKSISNSLIHYSLHSDALRNPDQAGLAYCNCETRVACATFHTACLIRPCSLIVLSAYIDLTTFRTTACTCKPKLNTLLNCTHRMLILSTLETSGIHGGLFVSLRCLEWTIILSDFIVLSLRLFCMAISPLGNMSSCWIYWELTVGTIKCHLRIWRVGLIGCRSEALLTYAVRPQGRALSDTCINWLDGRSFAMELSLMLPFW